MNESILGKDLNGQLLRRCLWTVDDLVERATEGVYLGAEGKPTSSLLF